MERRRPRLDPLVAEQAHERLAQLLAEHPPRRAHAAAVETSPPAPLPAAGEGVEDLPDLPPPRRFARRHLSVVAVLVALAAVMAGWSMLRSRPVAVADPGGVVTSEPGLVPTASKTPTAPPSAARIVVHVLGAVDHPGLVRLTEGSRVHDAIEAAGGLRANADPGELNLAQVLIDGQQVVIGRRGQAAGEVRDGGGSSAPGTGAAKSAVLDLNRATVEQLEQLPGVGPVTAGKVVAWREAHGRFSRVEELQEVDGIGPKTYAQIAPHVRV